MLQPTILREHRSITRQVQPTVLGRQTRQVRTSLSFSISKFLPSRHSFLDNVAARNDGLKVLDCTDIDGCNLGADDCGDGKVYVNIEARFEYKPLRADSTESCATSSNGSLNRPHQMDALAHHHAYSPVQKVTFNSRAYSPQLCLVARCFSNVVAASSPSLSAAAGLAPVISFRSTQQVSSALVLQSLAPKLSSLAPSCHGIRPGR